MAARLATLLQCRLNRPNLRSRKVDLETTHYVIGAGAIGLAVGRRLSEEGPTIVADQNRRIGEETSSRNSEVIHAGIYYPADSLKTWCCIRGKRMLYELAPKHNIPHKKIGKWIFARTSDEIEQLDKIEKHGRAVGVPLKFLSDAEISSGEPELKACAVLSSPSTGIIDSHELMKYYEYCIEENDGYVALRTKVTHIERVAGGYLVETPNCVIKTKSIINAGGLHSDKVACLAMGEDMPPNYVQHYCKGVYVAYQGKPLVSRLAYPVPEKNLVSLGVHTTIDIAGKMKLGPDSHYVDEIDYTVPKQVEHSFYEVVKRYLPNVKLEYMCADYAGIRPKLTLRGEKLRDFILEEESEKGYPAFVNCIGIESPGLTSSLAIAEIVAEKLGYKNRAPC